MMKPTTKGRCHRQKQAFVRDIGGGYDHTTNDSTTMHKADNNGMMQMAPLLLACCFMGGVTWFGSIPGTFANYGWNYFQFLPFWCLGLPVFLAVFLFHTHKKFSQTSELPGYITWSFAIFLCICFVAFRTRIHCFGGDGNVFPLLPHGFAIADFIFPPAQQDNDVMQSHRLDGCMRAVVWKICERLGAFEKTDVLPSVFASQMHTILFGCLFVLTAAFALRRRTDIFLILTTSAFVANFFGNVDSYAVSLYVGLVFFLACIPVWQSEIVGFKSLVGLGVLWCIGLWAHPFHAFSGFSLALLFTRYLRRFESLRKLPDWTLPVLYTVVFVVSVKFTRHGAPWFTFEPMGPWPMFSADTLTHYLNCFLLPILPLVAGCFFAFGDGKRFRALLCLFLCESFAFSSLILVLGAVDQFNYFQLYFFFAMPWLLELARAGKLRLSQLASILACNLLLLIPMIAVNSTHATLRRAKAVYPKDLCKHNRSMSWQTHLGVFLAENTQNDPEIRRTVLSTFADGALHAEPPGFRLGNALYHAAYLYNYGFFQKGRSELFPLLLENPNLISWFLNPRPMFIFCNRRQLWQDIGLFLQQYHPGDFANYQALVKQLDAIAERSPYFVKTPVYR